MSSARTGLYRLHTGEIVRVRFFSTSTTGDLFVTYSGKDEKLITVIVEEWNSTVDKTVPYATRIPTFCVFEGVDKSGKTTQAAIFANGLRAEGYEVVEMRFPDRTTPTGEVIDRYLKSSTKMTPEQQHLIFSANRWEMQKTIREHLDAGKFVVCDRYLHSGVAYSMVHGCPEHLLANADKGLIMPDLVFYLTASPEVQRRRTVGKLEVTENADFQAQVRLAYPEAFKMFPCEVKTISADGTKDEVTEAIKKALSS